MTILIAILSACLGFLISSALSAATIHELNDYIDYLLDHPVNGGNAEEDIDGIDD